MRVRVASIRRARHVWLPMTLRQSRVFGLWGGLWLARTSVLEEGCPSVSTRGWPGPCIRGSFSTLSNCGDILRSPGYRGPFERLGSRWWLSTSECCATHHWMVTTPVSERLGTIRVQAPKCYSTCTLGKVQRLDGSGAVMALRYSPPTRRLVGLDKADWLDWI